jgi:hypothetical protein
MYIQVEDGCDGWEVSLGSQPEVCGDLKAGHCSSGWNVVITIPARTFTRTSTTGVAIRNAMPQILGLGALYEDTILTIPKNLRPDSKQRATDKQVRIGGNIINTFHVLSEAPLLRWATSPLQLKFVGSVGTYESCK